MAVTLIVIAKAFVCGECFYTFVIVSVRRAFSTIRKFSKFLNKIKQIIARATNCFLSH